MGQTEETIRAKISSSVCILDIPSISSSVNSSVVSALAPRRSAQKSYIIIIRQKLEIAVLIPIMIIIHFHVVNCFCVTAWLPKTPRTHIAQKHGLALTEG